MEITRRVMTNVEKPAGIEGADGAVRPPAHLPRGRRSLGHRAERRHAVHAHVARRVEGAVDSEHPGHEGSLLPVPDARRAGPTCSRTRASARREPRRRNTRSRARAGRARCRPASPSTSRRPAWYGCLAASIAPARPKTTRPCTRCRIRSRRCRCPPMASRIPRRPVKIDPAIDMKAAARDQVNAMDGAAYFKLFAELLKTNPPAADDAPMVAKLAKIGIVPGQDFDAVQARPGRGQGHRRRAQARAGQDQRVAEGGDRRRRRQGWRTAGCSSRSRACTARAIASAR